MTGIPGALGLSAEQTRDVLVAAGTAPSQHNTQPWMFRPRRGAIELLADPRRRAAVADPEGRELRLACGAALLNLRIAIAALGGRTIVTVLPDRDRPELVAVVRDGGRKPTTSETLALADAIPHRHSNRGGFDDRPVAAAHRNALCRAALHEGAWLHLVDDAGECAQLTALATDAHRARLDSPAFRAEIEEWTACPGRADGVPASAGGPQPEPRAAGDPMIAILIAHSTGPATDVRTGAAMQRVLLAATASGLAASFLPLPVDAPATRESMHRLVGTSRPPEVVLQVGHACVMPVTARRPVEDLLALDATH